MLVYIVKFCTAFGRKMMRDNISAYAAHAAFFIMLSFFPFMLMFLNIFHFLPFEVGEVTDYFKGVVPNSIYQFVASVMSEIVVSSSGIYFYVSLVILLWSASRGFLAIVCGIRSIYSRVDDRNYFIQRLSSTFYTLVFALILLVTIILLVFGNLIYEYVLIYFPELSNFVVTFINFRTVITLALLFVYFLMLYKLIGNKKASWISALPGAVLASVGWILFSFAFSIYIDYLSNLTMTYGSLTTIVFCMLWLYSCMYIVMFGAEVNLLFADASVKKMLQVVKCNNDEKKRIRKKMKEERILQKRERDEPIASELERKINEDE